MILLVIILARRRLQSFHVEGPQNREISLFIENAIGRFLRELFKVEKNSRQQLLSYILDIPPNRRASCVFIERANWNDVRSCCFLLRSTVLRKAALWRTLAAVTMRRPVAPVSADCVARLTECRYGTTPTPTNTHAIASYCIDSISMLATHATGVTNRPGKPTLPSTAVIIDVEGPVSRNPCALLKLDFLTNEYMCCMH